MPIEIRELVIRANVEPAGGAAGMGGCGTAKDGKTKEGGTSDGRGGGHDDAVQECVREVLRILESRRER
jgi:hypothetical protein